MKSVADQSAHPLILSICMQAWGPPSSGEIAVRVKPDKPKNEPYLGSTSVYLMILHFMGCIHPPSLSLLCK